MSETIKGKTAIITGSSRGIGYEIAKLFAEEGANILLNSSTAKNLDHAYDELSKLTDNIAKYVGDIGNPETCRSIVERTIAEFGRVDILINNAGIGIFNPVDEMSDDDWDKMFRTNVYAPFYLSKACLPIMKKQQNGHIFNISSLAGQNTFPTGSGYCATKHALNGFTECLMLEARQHNIKVSYICPGSVNTTFADKNEAKDFWKVPPSAIAKTCIDLYTLENPALISKVEIRPVKPPKK